MRMRPSAPIKVSGGEPPASLPGVVITRVARTSNGVVTIAEMPLAMAPRSILCGQEAAVVEEPQHAAYGGANEQRKSEAEFTGNAQGAFGTFQSRS